MLFEEKVFISHGMTHMQPIQHVSSYCTDCIVQSDQEASVHLTITVQSSGAQRLFDYPVYIVPFLQCARKTCDKLIF